MLYTVKVYNKKCSIVSINKIKNEAVFVLKEIKKNKYHIIYESSLRMDSIYSSLKKFKYLLKNPVELFKKNDFYYIDENFKFKVYAKIPNKWIVRIFNKKNKLENCFEDENFKKINEGYYILENYKNYPKKYKYKEKYLNFKNVEDFYYESDEIIAECLSEVFNCKYYYDLNGVFRIKNKEEITLKEKEFIECLNEGFEKYYNGIYTFTELIIIYTKMDYSLNGFMEIFDSSLISDNYNSMKREEIKKDIIKILKSEKKSYEK